MKNEKLRSGRAHEGKTRPHCIRMSVKKFTLCALNKSSSVKPGQLPNPSMRLEKGTPLRWRYQNDLHAEQILVSDGSMQTSEYAHGHRAQRLENPKECISVQHQSPVDQAVCLDVSGRPLEQVRLWRL